MTFSNSVISEEFEKTNKFIIDTSNVPKMIDTLPRSCIETFIDFNSSKLISFPWSSVLGTASTVIASATTSCKTNPIGASKVEITNHVSALKIAIISDLY